VTALAGPERVLTPQFLLLWAGGFTLFLSFFLLLPTLPTYARALGVPEARLGLLTGAFPVAAMLVRPVAGWAVDRHGRRPFMLGGAALFVVAPLLYAGSHSLGALMAVRALHGVGMGLYPTGGTAMAADMAPPARRGFALGLVGTAANVALAVGPLLGIWLVAARGYHWLFAASASLAILTLLMTLAQRESLRAPVRVPLSLDSAFSRAALYPCAVMLAFMTTYGALATYLPLYAAARGANAGLFFTVMAAGVIASRAVAGGLSDRLGRAPVAAAGTLCGALALVVVALAGGSWGLVAGGLVYGAGLGAANPALVAWCVDLVGPTERGKALGTFYSALELGIAAGALGAGSVLARAGYAAVFLLGAGVAAVAFGLAVAAAARPARFGAARRG
jgi:MFS family permease